MKLSLWTHIALVGLVGLVAPLAAQTPDPVTVAVTANVFEVVVHRPLTDPMTYAEPLPWDKLSFQERASREYLSVGTAFSIGGGRFVTAAHVLNLERPTLQTEYGVRTVDGTVYPFGAITALSTWRDFAVFQVPGLEAPGLAPAPETRLNTRVFTAGNALGSGLVVREGLLTSRTPEEWQGRWQNLRFSAPASPGNSGGPLLNDKGELLGVVTRKSENENLNYALPWSEVDLKPIARLDELFRYGLPLANDWIFVENHKEWALPLTTVELRERLTKVARDSQTDASVQLRQKLVPGAGVVGVSRFVTIPGFLERKENGSWEWGIPNDAKSTRIGADGSVNLASRYDNTLFALTAPSGTKPYDLAKNPQKAMDLFLQANAMSRTVAGKPIRVLSFGPPTVSRVWQDRYGRQWVLSRFDLPELDFSEELLWLPTPTGGMGMVRGITHDSTLGLEVDLLAMTDYVITTYSGTLEHWTEFLSHPDLLPTSLRSWSFYWKAGQTLVVDTGSVRWEVPAAAGTIGPRSVFAFAPAYFSFADGLRWLEGTLAFGPNGDYRDYFALNRNAKPQDDDADAVADWKRLTDPEGGFDAIPFNTKDRSIVRGRLKNYPINPPFPDTLYWMVLYADGLKDHAPLRARFRATIEATDVHAKPFTGEVARRSGTSLFDALRVNDTALVDRFFDEPAALSQIGPDDLTPLQVAVQSQRWDLAERLLKAGATTTAQPGTLSPVLGALRAAPRPLVEALVAKSTPEGALVEGALDRGWSDLALTWATTPALRDRPNAAGRTPLMTAAARGDETLALALLDKGAKADLADEQGWTALHYAVRHGLETLAFRLWKARPELLAAATKDGWTGLHLAAAWQPDWLPRLVKGNGASLINRPAQDGTTPLLLALKQGDGWKTLLDAGANPLLAQKDGWNATAVALRYGPFGALSALPAAARAPTKAAGWNLLHLAARYRPLAFDDLVEAWTPQQIAQAVKEKGPGGRTALHLAVLARSAVALRWLVAHGASLEARDDQGRTPLDQARAQGDEAWFLALKLS